MKIWMEASKRRIKTRGWGYRIMKLFGCRENGGSTRKRIFPPLPKIQLCAGPHWGPALRGRREKCKSQQPHSRTACVITVTTQPGMLHRHRAEIHVTAFFGHPCQARHACGARKTQARRQRAFWPPQPGRHDMGRRRRSASHFLACVPAGSGIPGHYQFCAPYSENPGGVRRMRERDGGN